MFEIKQHFSLATEKSVLGGRPMPGVDAPWNNWEESYGITQAWQISTSEDSTPEQRLAAISMLKKTDPNQIFRPKEM